MDRLLRPLARRMTRSRLVQRLAGETTNARGDRLDPQVGAMLWLQNRVPVGLEATDVGAMRAAMRQSSFMGAPTASPLPIHEETVADCRVRFYTPSTARGSVVFLHGGGWVVGDLETHDPFCRTLATKTDRTVVAVHYPLAPEHPFPVAIHAVADVWRALRPRLTGPVALMGDSAGANLAVNASRVLRDAGDLLPDRQVLVYPGLDPRTRAASHREFADGFILTAASIRDYLALYAPDPDDPLGSPIDAPDLAGLPPTLLTVAGFDPLRDEGLTFADRLRAAGVPTDVLDEPGLTHGYLQYDGLVDEAARANQRLFDALNR